MPCHHLAAPADTKGLAMSSIPSPNNPQALKAVQAASTAPLVDPTTGGDLRLDPAKLNVAQLQVGAGDARRGTSAGLQRGFCEGQH